MVEQAGWPCMPERQACPHSSAMRPAAGILLRACLGGAGGSWSGTCPAPLALHTQVGGEPCSGSGQPWARCDGAPPCALHARKIVPLGGPSTAVRPLDPASGYRRLARRSPAPGSGRAWAQLPRGAVGQRLTRGLRSPERNLQEKALPFPEFFFLLSQFFPPI